MPQVHYGIDGQRIVDKKYTPEETVFIETVLRPMFEKMHANRHLSKHHLRGTYQSANIAALWNQHVKTALMLHGTTINIPRLQGVSHLTMEEFESLERVMTSLRARYQKT